MVRNLGRTYRPARYMTSGLFFPQPKKKKRIEEEEEEKKVVGSWFSFLLKAYRNKLSDIIENVLVVLSLLSLVNDPLNAIKMLES